LPEMVACAGAVSVSSGARAGDSVLTVTLNTEEGDRYMLPLSERAITQLTEVITGWRRTRVTFLINRSSHSNKRGGGTIAISRQSRRTGPPVGQRRQGDDRTPGRRGPKFRSPSLGRRIHIREIVWRRSRQQEVNHPQRDQYADNNNANNVISIHAARGSLSGGRRFGSRR
jgi:hypothetical protein